MATEQRDSDYDVYLWHTIEASEGEDYKHRQGFVATVHGFVRAVSHQWDGDRQFTELRFIYRERMYVREMDAFYQPRYLVTLARRFAEDVMERQEAAL